MSNTSWQKVSKWYNDLVDDHGHYYHEHVIIPGVIKLLKLKSNSSLLDLACGQGVLARNISQEIVYLGIDESKSFIQMAKQRDHNLHHSYVSADVTQPLTLNTTDFTHATIILALQNIETPELVISNVQKHIKPNGILVIVLNHPCFRIPRQSSWGIDEQNKLQYRRINRYLSPLKIPVQIHPGQNKSPIVWSFHHSLSDYSQMLFKNGFMIENIEEWTSDKASLGKVAKMENRGRSEFPLFLAIKARKVQ